MSKETYQCISLCNPYKWEANVMQYHSVGIVYKELGEGEKNSFESWSYTFNEEISSCLPHRPVTSPQSLTTTLWLTSFRNTKNGGEKTLRSILNASGDSEQRRGRGGWQWGHQTAKVRLTKGNDDDKGNQNNINSLHFPFLLFFHFGH